MFTLAETPKVIITGPNKAEGHLEVFSGGFGDREQGTNLGAFHPVGKGPALVLREGVDSCLKGVPSLITAFVGHQGRQERCFPRGLEHLPVQLSLSGVGADVCCPRPARPGPEPSPLLF